MKMDDDGLSEKGSEVGLVGIATGANGFDDKGFDDISSCCDGN